jgi:hypothetical protein
MVHLSYLEAADDRAAPVFRHGAGNEELIEINNNSYHK